MKSEIAILGLYVPGLLFCAVVASALWFLVDALMLRMAAWQWFWHPPLARLALYFLLLALAVALVPEL
ncbi:DUF1656 domain-containing protein [Falsirhodobacter algicola]|uniref:DUF1656 domain-containing protein n=1 Tax=Falsirhodobacter algicola TaxID=2692330 RepID=A0A8J8MQM3_9RHOB|nr:DUF1656 domain-containing protein [Falsirhodobacter algicola]QUS34905.1 DUF1656 domain-containing protein [Falsirhodobacter algicola]